MKTTYIPSKFDIQKIKDLVDKGWKKYQDGLKDGSVWDGISTCSSEFLSLGEDSIYNVIVRIAQWGNCDPVFDARATGGGMASFDGKTIEEALEKVYKYIHDEDVRFKNTMRAEKKREVFHDTVFNENKHVLEQFSDRDGHEDRIWTAHESTYVIARSAAHKATVKKDDSYDEVEYKKIYEKLYKENIVGEYEKCFGESCT